MKVILPKKNLENGLLMASKAISPKTPFPVLSHFLLEAKNSNLKISATDLEVGIEVSMPAEIQEEGSFTVPAKTFQDIIGLMDTDNVNISKENDSADLNVFSDNSSCKIMTLHSDEFPIIPRSDDEPLFTMLQKDLRDAIKSIYFSIAAQEETRAVLTGMLMIVKDFSVRFVATDGKRLSMVDAPITSQVEGEHSYIVPGRVLSEIAKSVKNPGETVAIGVKNSQIFFKMEDIFVISRLLEGNYPKFEQVIPSNSKHKISINRNNFISALKLILVMAQEKNFPKLIKLEFIQDKLTLRSNTPDLGSAFRDIACNFTGDSVEMAFNGQYFIDVLSVLHGEDIVFEFTDEVSPGVIKPGLQDPLLDNYICVIMPIVIKDDI